MSDFKDLNLHPSILKAVLDKGYTTPTPIQQKSIPSVMKGKDFLGIAQTGTGKTAAFSLPTLNLIANNPKKLIKNNCRVLILTPTRELASQIDENIKTYGTQIGVKSAVIFGGVGKQPQINKLRKGLDILVATPGRLLDLMSEGHVKYEQLDVFILDEADRMLDMGFLKDVQRIITKLPKKKQTLLFSATMPNDISKLAQSLLNDPVKAEITPQSSTVEKIEQKVMMVAKSDKISLLLSVLEDKDIKSALIFSRTKHGADRIVKKLEKSGVVSAAIHGNKSQGARERALSGFKSGDVRVLVATDIAARGIDIPRVGHIINFNIPEDAENYVHRIGRTGRAGRIGVAISFCDETEIKLLKNVEKIIKKKLDKDTSHGFLKPDPNYVPVPKQNGRGGAASRGRPQSNSSRGGSNKSKPGTRSRRR